MFHLIGMTLYSGDAGSAGLLNKGLDEVTRTVARGETNPEDLEDEEAGAQPGGGPAGSGGLCDLGTDRGSRSSSEDDSMTIASAT